MERRCGIRRTCDERRAATDAGVFRYCVRADAWLRIGDPYLHHHTCPYCGGDLRDETDEIFRWS